MDSPNPDIKWNATFDGEVHNLYIFGFVILVLCLGVLQANEYRLNIIKNNEEVKRLE